MKRIDKVNKNRRVRTILSNGHVLEGNNLTIGRVVAYMLATEKETEILAIEEVDGIQGKVIRVILDNTK
jgi:hypothetical protein